MKKVHLLLFLFHFAFNNIFSQSADKTIFAEFGNYSLFKENPASIPNQSWSRAHNLLYWTLNNSYTEIVFFDMGESFHNYEVQQANFLSFEEDINAFLDLSTTMGDPRIGVAIGDRWNKVYKQADAVEMAPSFNWLTSDSPPATSVLSGSDKITSNPVSLPFNIVDLDGNPVNQIYISTNGFIQLQSNSNCSTCVAGYLNDPQSLTKNIVAGLWDHYNMISVKYFTNTVTVAATSRKIFVIEWDGLFLNSSGSTGGSAKFQIQIHEDDSQNPFNLAYTTSFPFHYEIYVKKITDPFQQPKTIGLNDPSGTVRCAAVETISGQNIKYERYPYPSSRPDQGWIFYPGKFENNSYYNVYNFNHRRQPGQKKIEILTTEFEYWGDPNDYQPYFDSWSLFQYQLKRMYQLAHPTPGTDHFKIKPYLNVFRDIFDPRTHGSVWVPVGEQATFIDDYSDGILLATYVHGWEFEWSSKLELRPYILWKDKAHALRWDINTAGQPDYIPINGGRAKLFADNTKPTHVQYLFSAESFFLGEYLHFKQFSPWEYAPGSWTSYDDYYFNGMQPDEKVFETLQRNLDLVDPYNGTTFSANEFPDPGNQSITIRQQSFDGPTGNILDGSAWFKFGLMPNSAMYLQGPTEYYTYYSSGNTPTLTSISSSRDELDLICSEQNITISTIFPLNHLHAGDYAQEWFKWQNNGIGDNKQFILDDSYTSSSEITVPPPSLYYSNDKYLSSLTTADGPPQAKFIGYPLSYQTTVFGLGNPPFRLAPTIHTEVLTASPAKCPNFIDGSAQVSIFNDSTGNYLTSGIVDWHLIGTNQIFTTDTIVSLPFSITNLRDGIWKFIIHSNGRDYKGQVTINKENIIRPSIFAEEIYSCADKLYTQKFAYDSYQWLLNDSIPVGNSTNIVAVSDGSYSVQVSKNGCTSTSLQREVKKDLSISIVNYRRCKGISSYTAITNDEAELDLSWKSKSGINFYKNGSSADVFLNTLSSYGDTITCTVTNQCGQKASTYVVIRPDTVSSRRIDFNCNISNSSMKLSNDKEVNYKSFNIFPNPTTGLVKLNYKVSNDETVFIEVYSTFGVKVIRKQIPSNGCQAEIDLSDFNTAIYYYKVIINGNSVSSGKISLINK